MNLPAVNFHRRGFGGSPLTLGLVLLGAVAAYVSSTLIINEDITGLEFLGMAVAACVVTVTILDNWRRGLLIFVVWLLFEDFARKYLGNNMAIYFAKDFLAAVFYLSFFIAIKKQKIELFRPPFRVPLLLIIWFGIVQVLNPASPSIFFGLMGLKLFFYYMPLLLVGYSLFNSEEDLRRFFTLNLVLLVIIASLGISQSILGHTFLNPHVLQEDIRDLATLYRTSPISGLSSYRPTSVFVSTGRFANFLSVGWLLTLGFTGYLILRRREGRILAFIAGVVTAAALVLSASRGAFMWGLINALAFSSAFLWGAPWRDREVIRVLRTIQRTALGVFIALFLLLVLFPDALRSRLSFYSETMSPDSPQSELAFRSWDYPVQEFLKAFTYDRWPYGYGIGTSGLGMQYVSRLLHVTPINAGVESGFGAIIIEQGIVGLILWVVMSVAIVLAAWRVVRKLRGSVWFPLGFVIFWFSFLLFFPYTYGGIMAYEDFVLNAYLWLLLGILFRLPRLGLSQPKDLDSFRP
jgi:hypothetical protein